jgi:hypothetical protein
MAAISHAFKACIFAGPPQAAFHDAEGGGGVEENLLLGAEQGLQFGLDFSIRS